MINQKYKENTVTHYLKSKVKQVVKLNQDKFGDNRELYQFDETGNLIFHKIYEKDILIVDFLNEFNSENQILKKTDILSKEYWNFAYDEHHNLIGINKFDSQDTLMQEIILDYAAGKLVRETVKSENTICWIYDYEYNAQGRISRETEKKCNLETEGIVEFEYNEKNELIKESNFDENGKFSYAVEIKYNQWGDQIYSAINGDFGSETWYEYDYDQQQNWIKQYSNTKNKRKLIYARTIDYFNAK
jgi:YD repeat-containing protein